MDSDSVNKEFYNAFASIFDKIPFEEILTPIVVKYLPAQRQQILDIGSGAGALAAWLTSLGHHVTCIEPAEEPAERAKEKGLDVQLTRFQDFKTDRQFDGIFAISSLIHVPRLEISAQIEKIACLLNSEGVVFVSFIEGETEGYEDPTHKGKLRFFSKFTEKELTTILSNHFLIVERHRIEVKTMKQFFLLFVLK